MRGVEVDFEMYCVIRLLFKIKNRAHGLAVGRSKATDRLGDSQFQTAFQFTSAPSNQMNPGRDQRSLGEARVTSSFARSNADVITREPWMIM